MLDKCCGLTAFVAFLLLGASVSSAQLASSHKLFNIYYGNWDARNGFSVSALDSNGTAKHLDVLTYAFVNIGTNASGQYECTSWDSLADNGVPPGAVASTTIFGISPPPAKLHGNFADLLALKQKYPNLKIVVSIGSVPADAFAVMAATDASRKHFVSSCIADYIKGNFSGAFGQSPNVWENPLPEVQGSPYIAVPDTPGLFDGFDIDWEFIQDFNTGGNFVALMEEFRTQLDTLKPNHYLLSFAGPNGSWAYQYYNLADVSQYCTYINVMNYDYNGDADGKTGFVAPLYVTKYDRSLESNVASTISGYLGAGVPANKILLGIPFYGYGWEFVVNLQQGQYEFGVPTSSATYSELLTLQGQARMAAPFRDDFINGGRTSTPWLFDGNTFWTFDDPKSIAQKMHFVRDLDLGGAFAWRARGDDSVGTLGEAIYNGLNQ